MPSLGVEGRMCGWGGCCEGMLLDYVRLKGIVVVVIELVDQVEITHFLFTWCCCLW